MLFGIDVSHHQNPASLAWSDFGSRAQFCIARACYGTMRDRAFPEHVRFARAAGLRVGAYLFFRPSQPVDAQLATFREACLAAGYGRAEDIVPVLDFEDDTEKRPITPADAPLAEQLAGRLYITFGSRPLVYITQRDWGRVGKPAWVLDYPLWVAHYAAPSRKEPATPNGAPYAIWQHRVGRFNPDGPNGYYGEKPQIDQNRAHFLPLLSGEAFTGEAPPALVTEEAAIEREQPDSDGTASGMHALLAASIADRVSDETRRSGHREMSGLDETEPVPLPDAKDIA
jgi:lysozyme